MLYEYKFCPTRFDGPLYLQDPESQLWRRFDAPYDDLPRIRCYTHPVYMVYHTMYSITSSLKVAFPKGIVDILGTLLLHTCCKLPCPFPRVVFRPPERPLISNVRCRPNEPPSTSSHISGCSRSNDRRERIRQWRSEVQPYPKAILDTDDLQDYHKEKSLSPRRALEPRNPVWLPKEQRRHLSSADFILLKECRKMKFRPYGEDSDDSSVDSDES